MGVVDDRRFALSPPRGLCVGLKAKGMGNDQPG
jgi:hypothetical protein